MQEMITERSIAFGFKSANVTKNMLEGAIRGVIHASNQKIQKHHGKKSYRSLKKDGESLETVEISDENIKSFNRVARKYNIDFCLKRSKEDPNQMYVFFKARDAGAMQSALLEYIGETKIFSKTQNDATKKDRPEQKKETEKSRNAEKSGEKKAEKEVASGDREGHAEHFFEKKMNAKEKPRRESVLKKLEQKKLIVRQRSRIKTQTKDKQKQRNRDRGISH